MPTYANTPAERSRRPERLVLAVLVALCGLMLVAGFANKARCTGPGYDAHGVTQPSIGTRQYAEVCYSDIQYLWQARELDRHRFPYLEGGLDARGELTGGSVEYPVLTGMLIWLGSVFAGNDGQFLLASALLLAPFGLFTAFALGKLTRWRALCWSLAPALALYGFHNWDLAVVAVSTGGFLALLRWRRPFEQRAVLAAVLFGLGFALKLYPALFVLPLLALTWTRGARVGRVLAAAIAPAVLVNLPFVALGFDGWLASFTFQAARKVDITTNSIWFWAFRPYSNPDNQAFQDAISLAAPLAVLLGCALALYLGHRRYLRTGEYPFVAVCAAMLCAFLLLYKVHSPQYVLWLLPFFALLRVHPGWIVSYLLVDLVFGIGLFRWYYQIDSGIYDGFAAQAVMIGVWGRAALLAGLFLAFLRAAPGWHTGFVDGDRVVPGADLDRGDHQRDHPD
ncbi:glycosyltransferase family 87 protein [Sciscionella sediminilitoris]|uniref:glycosyltransferase family 87 protein n=1 Tax=Sciscionella sediminilitoris TaxID=1445613 RepID=UPI001E41C40E|nr:glycosyltransferase 87 family protein [Sciscionella sp. SE31]